MKKLIVLLFAVRGQFDNEVGMLVFSTDNEENLYFERSRSFFYHLWKVLLLEVVAFAVMPRQMKNVKSLEHKSLIKPNGLAPFVWTNGSLR